MGKTTIKSVKYLSQIWEDGKENLEMLKKEPGLDPTVLTDDWLEKYLILMLHIHADEWLVIDNINNNEDNV